MEKSSAFGFSLVFILSWGLPVYSVIYNQIYPSYQSALGVAYGFAIGCIIHLLMLVFWMIIRRSKMTKLELISLLASLVVMIALTIISDGGSLSKTSV